LSTPSAQNSTIDAHEVVYSLLFVASTIAVLFGLGGAYFRYDLQNTGLVSEGFIAVLALLAMVFLFFVYCYDFASQASRLSFDYALRDATPGQPVGADLRGLAFVERLIRLAAVCIVILAPKETIVPLQKLTLSIYTYIASYVHEGVTNMFTAARFSFSGALPNTVQTYMGHLSLVLIALFLFFLAWDIVNLFALTHINRRQAYRTEASLQTAAAQGLEALRGKSPRYLTSRRFLTHLSGLLSASLLFVVSASYVHVLFWFPSLALMVLFVWLSWPSKPIQAAFGGMISAVRGFFVSTSLPNSTGKPAVKTDAAS